MANWRALAWAWCARCAFTSETITGVIYCDNTFEFYFNGEPIKEDPISFTPHNAVRVSFTWDGVSDKVFAIKCQDYASASGYEYTQTSKPALGDGALLAEFDDGTVTDASWLTYTVTFGPTDASIRAGCSSSNLDACVVEEYETPTDWFASSFDDSSWGSVTEYTAAEAGWGRTPTYSSSAGTCSTVTSPLTKENENPSYVETTSDECLDPEDVLCGGDSSCTGDEGRFIWGADLTRDNMVLFRKTVTVETTTLGPATCSDPGITACAASPAISQRVRREIMDLTSEEWLKVVAAMHIMKGTSMSDGQSMYGSNFRTYDYFVVKHAVASMDSRGDQGHFSSAFATFHAAFVLEFEMSLLAVDVSIGAMPYWDGSSTGMFGASYFGSVPGSGSDGVVTDGMFSNWTVLSTFDIAEWAEYIQTVSGVSNGFSGSNGYLRGSSSTASGIVRFGSSWSFPAESQADCASDGSCWGDWYECIEGGHDDGNFHSGFHTTVGGSSGRVDGDLKDPVTSPNDPLFMFHHANVERNRLQWMQAHASEATVYYGYGGASDGCYMRLQNNCPSGIELEDVISALFPFTSDQLGLQSLSSSGITHADVLCYIGPNTAPYTYTYADPSGTDGADGTPVTGEVSGTEKTDGTDGTTVTDVVSGTEEIDGTDGTAVTGAVSGSTPLTSQVFVGFIILCGFLSGLEAA